MHWDVNDFISQCNASEDHLEEAKDPAVMEAAEYLKALSQSKTPVETGNLRGLHEVQEKGDGQAEIFVAGPYARYQHYGLDFRHETGQALYLESALVEGAPEAFEIMRRILFGG